MTASHPTVGDVVVHAHGRVSPADHVYAHDKVTRACRLTREPVLFTRVDLVAHADPGRERRAFAKAEVDLGGWVVRAHAADETMRAAIDQLDARLRHRLGRHDDRRVTTSRRAREDAGWRHGASPAERTGYFPRPAEEREVVRRKSFTAGRSTPGDAALDLERLDHDFFLFRNALTGEDNVIQRVGDGRYALIEPSVTSTLDPATTAIEPSPLRPGTMTLTAAIELLDLGDEPFVFFLDPATHRGQVVYRRYDGHYGLITVADPGT